MKEAWTELRQNLGKIHGIQEVTSKLRPEGREESTMRKAVQAKRTAWREVLGEKEVVEDLGEDCEEGDNECDERGGVGHQWGCREELHAFLTSAHLLILSGPSSQLSNGFTLTTKSKVQAGPTELSWPHFPLLSNLFTVCPPGTLLFLLLPEPPKHVLCSGSRHLLCPLQEMFCPQAWPGPTLSILSYLSSLSSERPFLNTLASICTSAPGFLLTLFYSL